MRNALARPDGASLFFAVFCLLASTFAVPARADGPPALAAMSNPATKVVPFDSVCHAANPVRRSTPRQPAPSASPTTAHDASICAPVINVMPSSPAVSGTSPTPRPKPVGEVGKSEAARKAEGTKFEFELKGILKVGFQSVDKAFVWAAFAVVVLGLGGFAWWKHAHPTKESAKKAASVAWVFLTVVIAAALLWRGLQPSKSMDVDAVADRVEALVAERADEIRRDALVTAAPDETSIAVQVAALRAELANHDAHVQVGVNERGVGADPVSRPDGPSGYLLLVVAVLALIFMVAFAVTRGNTWDRLQVEWLQRDDASRRETESMRAEITERRERDRESESIARHPAPFAAIHRVEDEADRVRSDLARAAYVPVDGTSTIEIDPLFVALTQLRSALEADAPADGEYAAVAAPATTGTAATLAPLQRPLDEKTKGGLDKALAELLDTLARRHDPLLAWRSAAIVKVREARRVLVGLTPPRGPTPPFANKV